MIPNHGGALKPMYCVLPVLRRPEPSELVTEVMDAQAQVSSDTKAVA